MTIIDRRSVFLLLSYLVLSCGGETSTPTAPTTPTTPAKVATSITVSPSPIAFTALGAPIQLTSTVKDQGGMVMTVTCSAASNGDTGAVGGVTYTKRNASQITTGNAATSCTSGITDMTEMFMSETSFNGNIGSWDVSSVTEMTAMFNNAAVFNQDISGWCVDDIGSAPDNFDTGTTAWAGGSATRPQWGTCP